MAMTIRQILTVSTDILTDGRQDLPAPLRLCAAIAVIINPFAGRYEDNLDVLSEEYGPALADRLIPLVSEALGSPATVFGKAVIVGEAGEVQHGSAVIHTRAFGDALRKVAKGDGVVPSCEKRAGVGSPIDVSLRSALDSGSLAGTDGNYLFSWELRVADAPHADEMAVIAAVGNGGRPNSRRR